MEINTLTPPSVVSATAAQSQRPEISSDFETFLKMLTVQMQNQDPLNPIDSSDYAVQLATFSGVEQQVQTNDLLRSLAAQMGAGGMAQMASWVGMEARSSAPVRFEGAPIPITVSPAETADQVTLLVLDEQGQPVQESALPLGQSEMDWAGVTSDGAPLPSGTYSFQVVSYALGQEIARSPAQSYGRVTEVQSVGGQTVLRLASGATLPVTDVTAVREPGAS